MWPLIDSDLMSGLVRKYSKGRGWLLKQQVNDITDLRLTVFFSHVDYRSVKERLSGVSLVAKPSSNDLGYLSSNRVTSLARLKQKNVLQKPFSLAR